MVSQRQRETLSGLLFRFFKSLFEACHMVCPCFYVKLLQPTPGQRYELMQFVVAKHGYFVLKFENSKPEIQWVKGAEAKSVTTIHSLLYRHMENITCIQKHQCTQFVKKEKNKNKISSEIKTGLTNQPWAQWRQHPPGTLRVYLSFLPWVMWRILAWKQMFSENQKALVQKAKPEYK